MIAALHHMAKMKQVAQARARLDAPTMAPASSHAADVIPSPTQQQQQLMLMTSQLTQQQYHQQSSSQLQQQQPLNNCQHASATSCGQLSAFAQQQQHCSKHRTSVRL